ncbi:Glycylpeptide N-tetradecanoyltransferase 2, partial [Ophiophagus hannah]
ELITSHGAIEPDKDNIRIEPYSLPQGFTWDTLDLSNTEILKELYMLLNENYVEDDDNMFRFDYSPEFLLWALRPPGWLPQWHCGVRVSSNRKLVGFISAIPAHIRIYDRRKCSKPRQLFKKLRLPSRVRAANNDQSPSTSCVSLVVSRCESEFSDGNRHPESFGHKEIVTVDVHVNQVCAVGEADMHTPALQHTYSSSQEFSPREESRSHKENDHSHVSLESLASFLINSTKSLEKTESFGSPDKEDHRCSFSTKSLFEKEEQAKFQVELFSPHSQQQVQPQHLAAQEISQQHLQEAGIGDWKPQHVVMSESVSIQASLSDEFLTKKGLTEVGRRKPLPHPRAWFVSLEGHSSTVRHSYVDLQPDGMNGVNNSLDYGDDMNEPKWQGQVYPQKDLDEVDQSGSEHGNAVCSPEDNTPRYVLKGGRRRGGQLPSLQEKTIKRSVESPSEPLPSTEHKITGHHGADNDGNDSDDGSHQRAGKKTPWQKREERPVMRFNLK